MQKFEGVRFVVMFVNITRWTPETARALTDRWMTVVNGTAPKPVLNAFAKMRIISQVISLPNRFAIMISEIAEKDLPETTPLSMYMQDVCTQKQCTVMTMEDWLTASETFSMETVPKPERWTK